MFITNADIQIFYEKLKFSTDLFNISFTERQFEIIDRGCPHIPEKLPDGKIAVYSFFYEKICLKVGKVGLKTKNRFFYQHYNPNSCNSNLAKSILYDSNFFVSNMNCETIDAWIKNNIQRIDVLIDKNFGNYFLNYIESFMQLYFQPRYEGS